MNTNLLLHQRQRSTNKINDRFKRNTDSKKLDIVKSIEFETRESSMEVDPTTIDRENEIDDYTDRLFNYLDENDHLETKSILPTIESNSSGSNPNEKDIKPLLCAFCPYFARNLQEFQIHIAKHTEKNFRCLLCNCMYKYRRDCVTHMKRKHSNTVNGSMSQYIQKIHNPSNNGTNSTSTATTTTTPSPIKTIPTQVEPKRYGCPYCSLMTKSTSSIYKHQTRKHASYPKIVHKYSTDDPTTRSLVAILKQKPGSKAPISNVVDGPNYCATEEQTCKVQTPDESNLSSSSTISLNNPVNSSVSSKHITTENISSSSNGRTMQVSQCSLCGYRARHQINVVEHVKKMHCIEQNIHLDPSEDLSNPLIIADDETSDQLSNYSLHTTVQAPLIRNDNDEHQTSMKPYADIHLSINIFLPKKSTNLFERERQRRKSLDRSRIDLMSDEQINVSIDDEDDDDLESPCPISSSHHSHGSLYKPHKCRRCFYRSNWKTDMLHHIRLKHQITDATKSDYLSMNFQSALRTYATYENTFGKVLKNRLLLPKINYIDCTWEELKSKLFLHNNDSTKIDEQYRSLSTTDNIDGSSSMKTNEEKSSSIDFLTKEK